MLESIKGRISRNPYRIVPKDISLKYLNRTIGRGARRGNSPELCGKYLRWNRGNELFCVMYATLRFLATMEKPQILAALASNEFGRNYYREVNSFISSKLSAWPLFSVLLRNLVSDVGYQTHGDFFRKFIEHRRHIY